MLSVSEKLEEAFQALPKCFSKEEPLGEIATACLLTTGGIFAILLCRESLMHRFISHEAHHASGEIMLHIGADHKVWSDEPEAYLHGWITEWVYNKLKKADLYKLVK